MILLTIILIFFNKKRQFLNTIIFKNLRKYILKPLKGIKLKKSLSSRILRFKREYYVLKII